MSFPVDNVREGRDVQEITSRIQEKFGAAAVVDVRGRTGGSANDVQFHEIWASVGKEHFLEMIDEVASFDFPQFHVISGNDDGESVSLNYHFTLFQAAGRGKRVGVTVTVSLLKDDLSLPSLFSRIPGVEYSEREMREMLGIDFLGLPNKALVFLPEDWDETVKPWRRDETGPSAEHVRELS